MITKRQLLGSLVGVALAAAAGGAAAQSFPSGPVKIIVPRAPGGGSDNITRMIGPALEKKLGVPVVIENRPDATAVLGADLVAKAKPDGYTVYLSDNSFYQNPAILDSLPYDTIKDFTAVTMLAQGPVILIVHPSIQAKTLPELIALAKKSKLTFASGGIGSSTHLVGVMLNLKAGTSITHVPFKSSGPALNALLGGHVSMQFGGISSARPFVEQGKVRAIALTGDRRDPSMPDVPTFQEGGLQGADVTSVWGIHAPAGTPLAVRRVLRDAVVAVMREPEMTKTLAERGYDIIGNTPEEHQKQTEALVTQWIEVGKKVNLKE
ncbi:MAG: tripartite tricarboxylate transporter substrate binding protein [Alphaproteobacteria bacterium]|nr:tripartite tricarboxylate transporter substrate binding protein [Alphaproteobacteria bacterium]